MGRKPLVKIFRKSRGFTLVEVVAAMAIVGIALLSILGMLQMSNDHSALIRERLIAVNLLRQRVEEIKCMTSGEIDTYVTGDKVYSAYPNYTISQSASAYDPNSEGLVMRLVNLSLSWDSATGGKATETLSFVKADY